MPFSGTNRPLPGTPPALELRADCSHVPMVWPCSATEKGVPLEYSVAFDPDTGWGHVTVAGEVRLEAFPDALAAMWRHPEYARASFAIWDFTAAHTSRHLPEVVNLTTYIWAAKLGRGPSTIAIVASRDLEFGIGRMFAAFSEKCGYVITVYRTLAAARAWLLAQEQR